MPGEPPELEFTLNDVIDNRPLTPDTVDLATLRGFLEEVEKLAQHPRTKALSDVRTIQYPPSTNEVDERALENLWEKGRVAWRDVPSATDWVESLRGNI